MPINNFKCEDGTKLLYIKKKHTELSAYFFWDVGQTYFKYYIWQPYYIYTFHKQGKYIQRTANSICHMIY